MHTQEIKVWDPLVRVFHWSLASLFLLNYFATEDGGDLHELFGYIAVGLVVFRIIWGFIGTAHARFASFFPTQARLKAHWQEVLHGQRPSYQGHNPFGGAMVLLLLSLILGLGLTGYMMEEVDAFFGDDWLEELHEVLANLMMVAVVVHVTAVVVMQKWLGVQLVKPMITGKREL